MRNLFSTKRGERLARKAVHGPVGVGPGAQPFVELDRLAVPVEDRPLEPAASSFQRNARELPEQRAPHSMAALVGNHEEVLEVEPPLPEEGRELMKEASKSTPSSRAFRA